MGSENILAAVANTSCCKGNSACIEEGNEHFNAYISNKWGDVTQAQQYVNGAMCIDLIPYPHHPDQASDEEYQRARIECLQYTCNAVQ